MHYNSAILVNFSKRLFSNNRFTEIKSNQMAANSDLFRTFATAKEFS